MVVGMVQAEDYAQYVDVFTGTSATGHTTPAAAYPFGMVQAGPDSGNFNWAYCSGYQYHDQTVIGYSQTHLSGTGCTDMGDVQILPFTGGLSVRPAYRAVDKRQERGEPGYYTTVQSADGIKVEVTASKHVGLYRFTSLEGRSIKVLFNPAVGCLAGFGYPSDRDVTCDVSVPGRIRGGYVRNAWVRDRPMFYAVEFDRPWKKLEKLPRNRGENQDAYVAEFGPGQLNVRVALSQTSVGAAVTNMEAETGKKDFDRVRADARAAWNDLFARSTVEGDRVAKVNWYTALYHLYLQPNDWSDEGERANYTTLSLWDTFRAAQPWYTIVVPEIVEPVIESVLRLWRENGRLPVMSYGAKNIDCMIGNHSVPVIADAYLKGFRGFDAKEALAAITNTLTVTHPGKPVEDWDVYLKYGYFPFDRIRSQSVSRTLECAYDDWCAAKFAEALGERAIADEFERRARGWRNVFDTASGFARGKDSQGNWRSPFNPFALGGGAERLNDFTEGNSFQYTWHVQHDPFGFVEAMGGKERMATRLDGLFRQPENADGMGERVDVSGLIGQYAHGNEPSHHVIYFFQYVDRPDLVAKYVRKVFDTQYHPGPDGLCGNDDCGQMSAWYVFSALGFYPFNPCGGEFVIGAPQVPKATLTLPGGKTLTMVAKGLSKENFKVASVSFNGRPLEGFIIRYQELMAGGELVFEMSF